MDTEVNIKSQVDYLREAKEEIPKQNEGIKAVKNSESDSKNRKP